MFRGTRHNISVKRIQNNNENEMHKTMAAEKEENGVEQPGHEVRRKNYYILTIIASKRARTQDVVGTHSHLTN